MKDKQGFIKATYAHADVRERNTVGWTLRFPEDLVIGIEDRVIVAELDLIINILEQELNFEIRYQIRADEGNSFLESSENKKGQSPQNQIYPLSFKYPTSSESPSHINVFSGGSSGSVGGGWDGGFSDRHASEILSSISKETERSLEKTYRRKRTSDIWHWCKNCSHWPSTDYEESFERPSSTKMCGQCKSKEEAHNCK